MTPDLPGQRILNLLSRVCDRETLDRLVVPTLADLQAETHEAAGRGAGRRAWVSLRGHAALFRALALYAVTGQGGREVSRGQSHVVLSTLAAVLIFMAIFIAQPLADIHRRVTDQWLLVRLALTLIPQALGVAIPLGVLFGVALGASRSTQPRAARGVVAALGVGAVAMAATFLITGWVIPRANQSFRVQFARAVAERAGQPDASFLAPPKGPREMTSAELREAINLTRRQDPARARELSRTDHVRVALAGACVVLAMAGLVVAKRGGRRRLVRGGLAAMVAFVYYALLIVGQRWTRGSDVPPALMAWLANLVFLVLAVGALALPGRAASGLARPQD